MIDSVFLDGVVLNEYAEQCLEDATHFKIVRGGFKYKNRQIEFADCFDDAVNFAIDNPGDRPWMIYAVTENEHSAHIVNV